MDSIKIGIIGGSGLYNMSGFNVIEEIKITTPFGEPSDIIIHSRYENKDLYFLPRHGRGHMVPPHKINFRANIFALKTLGITHIISVSAVGSMKEEIKPGNILLPDQFIDITKNRSNTFFEDGIVAHTAFGDPLCNTLRKNLIKSCSELDFHYFSKGTYICIDGPQFSTRAESNVYRGWGVDVIGMTNVTEAKLSREAEICYATIALVTDYDCWHETEEDVTVESVLAIIDSNISKAKELIKKTIANVGNYNCSCHESLKNAIMTDKTKISKSILEKLGPIISKYC